MIRRVVLVSAALLVLVAGVLPVVAMLGRSFDVNGRYGVDHYRTIAASIRVWVLLGRTLVLGTATAAAALVVGTALGVLLGRTDLPGRRVLILILSLPLALPPYVSALGWFEIVGRQGLLAQLAGPAVGEWSSAWFFGLPGCLLVLGSSLMPVVMLLALALLASVDPRLEEAARMTTGWRVVLARITLPRIAPGLAFAAGIVFLLAAGELGVPMFLRYDVLPVESFVRFAAFVEFGAATAAAVPLALVTLLVLAMEALALPEGIRPLRPAAPSDPALRICLGRSRTPACAAVIGVALVLVAAPLGVQAFSSATAGIHAEAWRRAGDSLMRSIAYASAGATLLTACGFLTGYWIHSRALPGARALDALTLFLFALPATVLGIGLATLWNRPATQLVYGTPAILLLGYLAQYVALPSRVTVAALASIPSSMDEAAAVAGASWVRRTFWVTLPLARRGVIAAWLLAYIFCLRDLGTALILYPPGQDPMPVRVFTLMSNSPPGLGAALSMLLLGAVILPALVAGLLLKREATWR